MSNFVAFSILLDLVILGSFNATSLYFLCSKVFNLHLVKL